jgi:hypothetical protein
MAKKALLLQGAIAAIVWASSATVRAEVGPELAGDVAALIETPEFDFNQEAELAQFTLQPAKLDPLHVSALAIEPAQLAQDSSTPLPSPAPLARSALAESPRERYRLKTLTSQTDLVKWEVLAILGAMTATRYKDVTKGGSRFHVSKEGFFGRNTYSLGMDKMHHMWKSFVLDDVLQSIIENRGGDKRGAAYTAAFLGFGILTYGELLDGFTRRTGFSNEDVAIHFVGAGVSLARTLVPGLHGKLDFRMEIKPGSSGGSGNNRLRLVNQLENRKYLFAWQLAGHKKLENTPWRFVELHSGYYARGFSPEARAAGEPLRRKLFVGVGFNVQQLFARKPTSRWERYAKGVFDYIQVPYTSVHN